jgi:hypothetical protein
MLEISALDLTPRESSFESQNLLIGLVDFCKKVFVNGSGDLTLARVATRTSLHTESETIW